MYMGSPTPALVEPNFFDDDTPLLPPEPLTAGVEVDTSKRFLFSNPLLNKGTVKLEKAKSEERSKSLTKADKLKMASKIEPVAHLDTEKQELNLVQRIKHKRS